MTEYNLNFELPSLNLNLMCPSPIEQWVLSGGKRTTGNGDRSEMPNQKREETYGLKRFVHNVNYKGKNPMTKT